MYGGRVCKRHYGLKVETLNIWAVLSFTLGMRLWLQAKKNINNSKHQVKYQILSSILTTH